MKSIFLATIFCLQLLGVSQAKAQNTSSSESFRTWKRGTAIVLFSGVGGGILGLSTLSFYGQPSEHTSNITVGALLGVLAGVGYVIWDANNQASRQTQPQVEVLLNRAGDPTLALHMEF